MYNSAVRWCWLAVAALAACNRPVIVEVAIPDGQPAPAGLQVSAWDRHHALILQRDTRWPDPPAGPKQYELSLPDDAGEVRIVFSAKGLLGAARARVGSGEVAHLALAPDTADADWDGVPDEVDDCRLRGNLAQRDHDGDGTGDDCPDGVATVDVEGEPVDVDGRAEVALFRDFSDAFTYRAADFDDGGVVDDNQPRGIVMLEPPFAAEAAVLAGRTVLEVPPSGAVIAHDFAPAAAGADADRADHPTRVELARIPGDGAHLWVTGDSLEMGDGLFEVSPAWAMTRLLRVNNARSVVYDADGRFEGRAGERYLDDGTVGLERLSDRVALVPPNMPKFFVSNMVLGPPQTMYLAVTVQGDAGPAQLATLSASGYAHEVVGPIHAGRTSLVGGAPQLLDDSIWALVDERQLVAVDAAAGTVRVVAQSGGPDWRWTAATVPPPGYALGQHLFVVESNRTLDRDRVLVISP